MTPLRCDIESILTRRLREAGLDAHTFALPRDAAEEIAGLIRPVGSEPMVERVARALYVRNPFSEGGEYVDGFQVSPGGDLTWDQCCECQPAYAQAIREDARAAIEAMFDAALSEEAADDA